MNFEERYEELLKSLAWGTELLNKYRDIEPLANTPEKKLLYDAYLIMATPLGISEVLHIVTKSSSWENIEKGFALEFNDTKDTPWAYQIYDLFKTNRTKIIAILERFTKLGSEQFITDLIIDINYDLNKAEYRFENLIKFLK